MADIKLPYNPPAIVRDNRAATSLNTRVESRISEMSGTLTITPLNQLPLLKKGDDLAGIIVSRAKQLGIGIRNRDLVVIGQKAVSKAEGRIIDIDEVNPSARALEIAKKTGKSAQFVEIVLRESSKVLRADRDAFILRTRRGATCLNAGVDKSNVKGDTTYALLPRNPDASARSLRKRIRQLTGKQVAVVICDTRSRPFRKGQVEESIGVAGLNPLIDYRGQKDLFGYTLRFKNVSLADELASAAELVMGQGREMIPVAIVRGLKRVRFQDRATSRALVVRTEEDLFKGTL
jgi:coenzyme F420-0:L-glutamate ligase / coenzyme F420-1:gamma-L-glutamate ligase